MIGLLLVINVDKQSTPQCFPQLKDSFLADSTLKSYILRQLAPNGDKRRSTIGNRPLPFQKLSLGPQQQSRLRDSARIPFLKVSSVPVEFLARQRGLTSADGKVRHWHDGCLHLTAQSAFVAQEHGLLLSWKLYRRGPNYPCCRTTLSFSRWIDSRWPY